MMQAWAADAGAAAEHGQAAFYSDPTFWVLVGFIMLVAFAGKTIYRVATLALDDRAESIRNQIDEARKLREDAQELLASYQRKQREAAEEAEAITSGAKAEAERLAAKAAADLEASLKRREQQAMDRIARAEAEAVEEVRTLAADLAVDAAGKLLAEQVSGKKGDALVNAAIKELPDKLH